jgi:hypothetical protein
VLEGDGFTSLFQAWTLEGTAPDDTVVRLYLDTACRGPVFRDVTSVELSEGVSVDLLMGPPNVFSAVAIDLRGVASACSEPIRVSFLRPERPELTDFSISPLPPTRATRFTIRGSSLHATRVRLWDGFDCSDADLIATMSAESFQTVGFEVDLEPNESRSFAVDAVNVLDQSSGCSSPLSVMSDQTPPELQLAVRSPMPSPELEAFVSLGDNDAFQGSVFLGPSCKGPAVASCQNYSCRAMKVAFPRAAVGEWSAVAFDAAGNRTACITSPEPWAWDEFVSPPLLELEFIFNLRARVPASYDSVRVFDGPDCEPGHQQGFITAASLVGNGLYLPPSDGGVLSAFGSSLDGGVFPCSAPVPWY